jgi:hypothetical protein
MFKKSVLVGKQSDPPVVGRTIFNGYAEVRTTPQDQPPFLKQRIRAGKDALSIWFHHFHAGLFKDMDELLGIKVIAKPTKEKSFLPKMEEMTPQEILEFSKSIDVHPAHLIPWDADKSLSLPTPLLELLIEISYEDISGMRYDQNDIYLAKAAIAYECERIRKHAMDSKILAGATNYHARYLSNIFTDVLSSPQAMKNIAMARITGTSQSLDATSSRSYPYIERVEDAAITEAEKILELSIHRLDLKLDIYKERIEGFVKTYQEAVVTQRHRKTDVRMKALGFFDDVMEQLAYQDFSKRAMNIQDIKKAVVALMHENEEYYKQCAAARRVYMEEIGSGGYNSREEAREFLFQLEDHHAEDMAYAVKLVLDGEFSLVKERENHVNLEGEYILQVGRIRKAFEEVGDGYQRNLLNNKTLLGLYNISVQKYVAPQVTPR